MPEHPPYTLNNLATIFLVVSLLLGFLQAFTFPILVNILVLFEIVETPHPNF